MKEVRKYTVQTFDEFNEAEQKKILDNYRNINTDYVGWVDLFYYCEELRQRGFGVGIRDIEYDLSCCQGSGASFTADHLDYKILLADLDIKHKDFWIAYLDGQSLEVKSYKFGDVHKYSKYIDTEYCVLDYRGAEHDWPHLAKDFGKILAHIENKRREACEWLYKALMDEMEYLESDEAVRDTIEANEYLFDTRTLKIA